MSSGNKILAKANAAKDDEFYTYYATIKEECDRYSSQFAGKIIYCCCDDPNFSEFWNYFVDNFETFKIKELIATGYNKNGTGFGARMREKFKREPIALTGDGSFESEESKKLMEYADIIITNPPFSLIRKFIAQIMNYEKKFLIIGPMTVISYRDTFPFIKDNKMWLGYTTPKKFMHPDGSERKFGNIYWYTNLDTSRRHEPIKLTAKYYDSNRPEDYSIYQNYNAININRCVNIPGDYDCPMGVPISFFEHYCPEQFEIISFRKGDDGKDLTYFKDGKLCYPFNRLIIKKRKENT